MISKLKNTTATMVKINLVLSKICLFGLIIGVC